jgi:putative transposase
MDLKRSKSGELKITHSLLLLAPTIPLAKAVQILKACSSKWINDPKTAGRDFTRQEGYGAFSVSASQTEDVIKYIADQAAHHAGRSYEDQFLEFLKKYGVRCDPAHVLGCSTVPPGLDLFLRSFPSAGALG